MEMKVRRFWSEEEICFLKENYPKNGGIFCAQHLCRTLIAVQGKAMVIGLRQSSEQKSIIRKREGINKDYNSDKYYKYNAYKYHIWLSFIIFLILNLFNICNI